MKSSPPVQQALSLIHVDLGVVDVDSLQFHEGIQFSGPSSRRARAEGRLSRTQQAERSP
ncbi:hypothetical protein ACIBBE_09060 [Streptomyces sp. NPDC051644]|uniref:hypothetical protein n=1 Tax=Streptomyces sp. NPDC051644 TaxID=3365666 RepID=UPI0037AA72F4